MLKTTSKIINSMTVVPNRVIIKLTRKEDELDLGAGNKIFIDPAFAREMHTPTVGIVVNFSEVLDKSLMRWETQCEIQKGDYAVFSYESSINALAEDDSRVMMDEKKDLYIIIDYEDLFVAKRNGKVIPLNGYVLCKPIPVEQKTKLILPEATKGKRSDKFAVIAHIGTRNKNYFDGNGDVRPELYDPMSVGKVGDIVLLDKNSTLPIEYEIHQSLGGRKETFYRIQRCLMKAVFE